MKRIISKIGFGVVSILMLLIILSAFVAGGILNPTKAANIQRWNYGILLYSAVDGEVTWIQSDSSQEKIMRSAIEAITKDVDKKNVHYVQYLTLLGAFSWELIFQNVSDTGIVFTFKQPLNE